MMGTEMIVGHAREDEKSSLRALLLEKRGAIPVERRRNYSARIAAGLRALNSYRTAARVMCYAAVRGEAETGGIIRECLERGARVALPRCDRATGRIEAWWIRDFDADLEIGCFGIPEPRSGDAAGALPGEIDLFIVPGVGFDPRGTRLGWGRGFYDALLAAAGPRAPKIGLSYEAQLLPRIAAGPRDVLMDMLVTEERTIDCGRIRATLDQVKQRPPGSRWDGGRCYHEP
ncbi:MAG: 5-formyltetrahydrofolate cyclo-ligase [Chlamydiota bacterium]